MSHIQHKAFPFAIKALDDDGSFRLYAAVFNNVDRQGEVIVPGAFANLDEFIASGWGDVNHRWADLGIATIDAAGQDAKGLWVQGRFHSTPDAQTVRAKVRERLERGKAVSCSIGYRVLEESLETREGKPVHVLKSIEVYEFSFVALPANPEATVMSAKGLIGLDTARTLINGVKSGRTISKANHTKLKCWAKGLADHGQMACKMASEMKAWLDDHAPGDEEEEDPDEAEPDSDPDDLEAKKSAAWLVTLKARAVRGRARATCP